MRSRIGIIGAGGFGREVFCLLTALQRRGADWEIVGFFDDSPSESNHDLVRRLGSRIVGPVSAVRTQAPIAAVAAVGSATARQGIVAGLEDANVTWPVLIHPEATLGQDNDLGQGTVVAAGARVSTNVLTGSHVHIDQNATVGHDVRLGDFSRLNPQACVSGNVIIGAGALIGANATVLQGLRAGDCAVIGAGAVVVVDVGARHVVAGVPARQLKSK